MVGGRHGDESPHVPADESRGVDISGELSRRQPPPDPLRDQRCPPLARDHGNRANRGHNRNRNAFPKRGAHRGTQAENERAARAKPHTHHTISEAGLVAEWQRFDAKNKVFSFALDA
jgi:hypothetical protein